MSRLYPIFAQNFVVPVYDLMRGTSRFRCGNVLKKTQWLSQEKLEILQKKRLRLLLKHAYDTVPYYHNFFRKKSLKPTDFRSFDDLSKIPVLTKDDIRNNSSDLMSANSSGEVIFAIIKSLAVSSPISSILLRSSINFFRWSVFASIALLFFAVFSD